MVHTTFHQKQDMCSVHGKPMPCPCVVWHHSLSRNVTLWTIYNLTWNMTCVTHIWVNVKVFDNLRISSEFQLYEFAAALSVLKYHPSELDSDSCRVGITDLKQVSSPPSALARPGPGQVSVTRCFWANFHCTISSRPGPGHRASGLMATKLQHGSNFREKCSMTIFVFIWVRPMLVSRAWGVRGSEGDQSGTKERGETTYQCVPGAGGGGLGRLQS